MIGCQLCGWDSAAPVVFQSSDGFMFGLEMNCPCLFYENGPCRRVTLPLITDSNLVLKHKNDLFFSFLVVITDFDFNFIVCGAGECVPSFLCLSLVDWELHISKISDGASASDSLPSLTIFVLI